MPCDVLTIDGKPAHICIRGRIRRPKCQVKRCGRASHFECDYPVGEGTCDKRLCARHATRVGPELDYCPDHAATMSSRETREMAELPGEVLHAQYKGRCCLCGGQVSIGDKIHYHQRRTEHEACAQKALEALAPLAGAEPISYQREEPPELGRPVRLGPGDGAEGQVVVPLVHRRRYFREDGLSFGLSKDNGWLYTIEARPASADEVAELEAQQRAEAARAADRKRRIEAGQRVKAAIRATKPETPEPKGREWPAKRKNYDDDYLIIDEEGGRVWLVVYNGRDGDCWAWNNWRSSIVYEASLTPELRADLVALGALPPP
jgi:hypothetical protein